MKLMAHMLDLEINFLYLIIGFSIYVKKESFDKVPFVEAIVTYLIMTKIIVNFSYKMTHCMMDTAKHSKSILP